MIHYQSVFGHPKRWNVSQRCKRNVDGDKQEQKVVKDKKLEEVSRNRFRHRQNIASITAENVWCSAVAPLAPTSYCLWIYLGKLCFVFLGQ